MNRRFRRFARESTSDAKNAFFGPPSRFGWEGKIGRPEGGIRGVAEPVWQPISSDPGKSSGPGNRPSGRFPGSGPGGQESGFPGEIREGPGKRSGGKIGRRFLPSQVTKSCCPEAHFLR
jgi:hypothetical protein